MLFDDFLASEHYGLQTEGFHFAIEDPDLGLLELTCENGYVITDYDIGFPDVREVVYDRPLNDGTFDLSRYIGSRLVSLTIILNGEANPFFRRSNARLRSNLAAFAHPSRRPILSFVESDWPIRRRVVGRGKVARAQIAQRNTNVMQFNLVVPSGLIESYREKYVDVQVSDTATDHDVAVFNEGDVDAHWATQINNLGLSTSGAGLGVFGSGVELVLDPGTDEENGRSS